MMMSNVNYTDEYARIVELHEEYPNIFLPAEYMQTKLLPAIGAVVFVFTILFGVFYPFVSLNSPGESGLQKRRRTYQLTNLTVNLGLGLLGVYSYWYILPNNPTFDHYIVGSEHMYPLSALQIGYQLWALPVGLFLVRESPAMIAHHIATILVSGMAGFLTMGFRYWAPFFFGMIELSSVPLAVMNAFKDNPKWIEKHPNLYLATRLIFSLTFLFLRWYMYAPRKMVFLRHAAMVLWTTPSTGFQVYMMFVWIASAFLAMLQFWWGALILKGIVKVLFFRRKKSKKPASVANGKHA